MAAKRKSDDDCTEHRIKLCPESKEIVLKQKAQKEVKRQTSIDEVVNDIIQDFDRLNKEQ